MNLTCGVCIFFFFQAEDGIRDIGVTGVQTCALPISLFWTPLRVCLLFTTTVLAVAWLKQAPCADGDWTGSLQYTHLCYSDPVPLFGVYGQGEGDRKSTRLNSSHANISYAVFCLKKKIKGEIMMYSTFLFCVQTH